MWRVHRIPATLVTAIGFPLTMPVSTLRGWLHAPKTDRHRPWTADDVEKLVHQSSMGLGPITAFAAAWFGYDVSGLGSGGVGSLVRGAVLGWIGAVLVVAVTAGAGFGDVVDGGLRPEPLPRPLRYGIKYAAGYALFTLLVLAVVLVPLAFILSI